MAFRQSVRCESVVRGGMALGGIGCGSLEVCADGTFRQWTIFGNQPLGTGPAFEWTEDGLLFFLLRVHEQGDRPRLVLLQLEQSERTAGIESTIYMLPWLKGVDAIDAEFSFPFATLVYEQADLPLEVTLRAWSSFVPHDEAASSNPICWFELDVVSRSPRPVEVQILASLRNSVGYDTPERTYTSRILRNDHALHALMSCEMDREAPTFGTLCLSALDPDARYYAGWEHLHPYYERLLREPQLPDLDDTEGRNPADKETGVRRAMERLYTTLGKAYVLSGRDDRAGLRFQLAWHFPNLYANERTAGPRGRVEGRAYAARFADALEVAAHGVKHVEDLTARTRRFHQALHDTTAPPWLTDLVGGQLNTFLTSSWLTQAGDFGIAEGLLRKVGMGPLATIDVAMYGSVPTALLFPNLDRAMLEAHRRLQNPETGEVRHGIDRDFANWDSQEGVTERLDLTSQYACMVLRHAQWTGDLQWLGEMWPSVKSALGYVLEHRDKDGDGLPDMEGVMCSYDNFPMYGASSYVGSQWLAALELARLAAIELQDQPFLARLNALDAGVAFERKLWNGSYYRLANDDGGEHGMDEGCLTDQVLGEWFAWQLGLSVVRHAPEATAAVFQRNFRPGEGLCNCRWPEDEWLHDIAPEIWVDQANTPWTGVELGFAALLIQCGWVEEGLRVASEVDRRYRRAGLFFDHHEFGGHYFRPMAAWSILSALAGWQVRDGLLAIDPPLTDDALRLFWSTPTGYGHVSRLRREGGTSYRIDVLSGQLDIFQLDLPGMGDSVECSHPCFLAGDRLEFRDLVLDEGDTLWVKVREA